MVSGAEHAAVAELRAEEWKCALLVRRSVAEAWSLWEIASQSIDILESERQPVPDERRNVAHPRPRAITENSKDGSSILPGAWRRQEGKTTGMEVSRNRSFGSNCPTQLPTHGRILGI